MREDILFYEAGDGKFDAGEPEETVVVDAPYLEIHAPIVADPLKRVGVRLAQLLNMTLSQ